MLVIKIPESIYVSGPMTDYENWTYDEFDAAARQLKTQGWKHVANPVDHKSFNEACIERDDISTLALYDLSMVCQCSAIYMLRGWEKSIGARAEHATAVWIGLNVIYQGYK